MPLPTTRRSSLIGLLLLLVLSGLLLLNLTLSEPPRMLAAGLASALKEEPSRHDGPARLGVLLVFDQVRGDFLIRWEKLLRNDGFRRLARQGAWFQNCHYPYAYTVTGAGHASLGTGCSPDTHGIIGNDWYDRASGARVYCATTERHQQIPPATKPRKEKGAGSPERQLAPTLAETLKEQTDGKARVVSLSLKDRSAILPVGRRADACYWMESSTGAFVTSTFYAEAPHRWVEAFNGERRPERWFGRDWQRLRPGLNYGFYSGPDDVVGEGRGVAQGRTFPHPMRGGERRPGEKFINALYNSPFGNDLLLDFVERAVIEEQLGKDDVPDLLCVSFSSNDAVGHTWGPDSQEVLDTTLRTDEQVARLLAFLDARIGRGRYTVAVSADHGICPLPEVARATHPDARRVDVSALGKAAEAHLDRTFGVPGGKVRWFQDVSAWMYLNPLALRARNVKQADAETALADWLRRQPDVEAAYTRAELESEAQTTEQLLRQTRKSFHPERAGDVAVVLKPYCIPSSTLGTGTTHGAPHFYDTHVPLIVYGPGVQCGVRHDDVTPQAAAVILAHALGVSPPAKADVSLPNDLFSK